MATEYDYHAQNNARNSQAEVRMNRFEGLLQRANIELADLPPEVELNGVLIYLGEFPNGAGRLLLHPSMPLNDDPRCVAVIAHELAHLLLSRCTDHPPSVLDCLLDPSQHALYMRYEAEADALAACLLVPADVRAAYASQGHPTSESLADRLGVPPDVVGRALAQPEYDLQPVRDMLERLTGRPDFHISTH